MRTRIVEQFKQQLFKNICTKCIKITMRYKSTRKPENEILGCHFVR